MQKPIPERIFLLLEPKRPLYIYKKLLPRLRFFDSFDPEFYIRNETDALGYAISGVLSQMTSDQHSSGHVTHENPISSELKIG